MIIAVEDVLSEAVVRKLVGQVRPDIRLGASMGRQGKGYLKKRARELNRTASTIPVFLLVDQDSPTACPIDLISNWLGSAPQRKLLFRFAVMEVESWVLADRTRFAKFMGVPGHEIPVNADTLLQPKEFIIGLARRSRSASIRNDLVPATGSTAVVGPAYNSRLLTFVHGDWNPNEAAQASDSLQRAIRRLKEVAL